MDKNLFLKFVFQLSMPFNALRTVNENITNLKYILLWTGPNLAPFDSVGESQSCFVARKCQFTNCYVTSNKTYLRKIKNFDMVLFSGPELGNYFENDLPQERSLTQKYVFISTLGPHEYQICTKIYDDYFNWTWTSKFGSDLKKRNIIVKDSEKRVIGPKKIMHWKKLEDMDPLSKEVKRHLEVKSIAAAWYASTCHSPSKREEFIRILQGFLKKYSLTIDIFGKCGPYKCHNNKEDCLKTIREDHYFYMVFEKTIEEDSVSDSLLVALENFAVPIVFGGANYTRYMPDGMYLDAIKLGPEALAAKMNEIIENTTLYYDYFRWRKHYSYHRSQDVPESNECCRICAMLNDKNLMEQKTNYKDMRKWWNPPDKVNCQRDGDTTTSTEPVVKHWYNFENKSMAPPPWWTKFFKDPPAYIKEPQPKITIPLY